MPLPQQAEAVPFGGPQLVVLDTNWIFNDLVYQLRRGRDEGLLLRAAREGAVRLFAGAHVYREVYRRADTQAHRVDPNALIGLFENSYLPVMRFVELPKEPVHPRAEEVAAADRDDLPTAELALLLAPSLVLTGDSDLLDAGFGIEGEWLPVAVAADRAMRIDQMTLVAFDLGRRGWARCRGWARKSLRDLQPWELATGVMVGVVVLGLMSPAAHSALARGISIGERAIGGGLQLAAAGGLQVAAERGRQAETLSTASVPADPRPSLTQRAARHLGLRGPTGVAGLARIAMVEVPELERRLATHPAFVFQGSKWQLGLRLQPSRPT